MVCHMPLSDFDSIGRIEFTELTEIDRAGGNLNLKNNSILQTIKLYTTYKIGLRISDIKEIKVISKEEISKMDKQLIHHLTIKKGGKTKRKSRRNKK